MKVRRYAYSKVVTSIRAASKGTQTCHSPKALSCSPLAAPSRKINTNFVFSRRREPNRRNPFFFGLSPFRNASLVYHFNFAASYQEMRSTRVPVVAWSSIVSHKWRIGFRNVAEKGEVYGGMRFRAIAPSFQHPLPQPSYIEIRSNVIDKDVLQSIIFQRTRKWGAELKGPKSDERSTQVTTCVKIDG